MATRKVKHAKAMEKRARFFGDEAELGLQSLRASQEVRRIDREKAEASRKDRAAVKSKRLAKAHKAKPAPPKE